jgi:hypothetical protein
MKKARQVGGSSLETGIPPESNRLRAVAPVASTPSLKNQFWMFEMAITAAIGVSTAFSFTSPSFIRTITINCSYPTPDHNKKYN